MKRTITILAIDEDASVFYKNQLDNIFEGLYHVEYRNLEMNPLLPIYNSDLILYTDPQMVNELISIISCDVPQIMMKRTITKESLKKIKEIPSGKKVLVANINQYMANETVALIHQLGVTNIELIPFYENMTEGVPEVDYIINVDPHIYDFLPDTDAEILIIGHRVFDISNILDILSFLRLDGRTADRIIKNYIYKVPTSWHGIHYTWMNRNILNTEMSIILDNLSSGVIVTDEMDIIEVVNDNILTELDISREEILGKKIKQMFKYDYDFISIFDGPEVKDELVTIKGKNLILTMKVVNYYDDYQGRVLILNKYSEVVSLQQKIHSKIVGKGYFTKHSFSKMVGKDPNFLELKQICKRISKTDAKVLLLGESGTGKEVFAGSIHNESLRSKHPFIAINCATLPESLLESILFGYEEGAFTGGKKNGKIGLFESANKGTIFLDEIGELPISLQARLLRVLEEGEIMKIGGDEIINVDVRIIAATNRDLKQLVDENKFRQDLYYRLNIFQTTLLPLRDRRGDIEYFIKEFLAKNNVKRFITRDFKIFCENYSWPGNIRELKNIIEYMITIYEGCLSFENLPKYLKERENYIDKENDGSILLLKTIYNLEKVNAPTGRRTLQKVFNKLYFKVSEIEIRKFIEALSNKGYIKIEKGRTGNSITSKGIDFLIQNEYCNGNCKEGHLEKLELF